MLHGSDSIPKKLRKTLNKRHTKDCFDDLMKGEFFNGAFKKSLLIFHECPSRREGSPVITG
jgi:hypothetical protein